MLIELRGVEFVNKGAELMLHAIMHKVKENIPEANFVMEPTSRVPPEKLSEYNIYVKKGNNKARFIPPFIRKLLRFALDKDIDVVFDASGFAFGDQWGAKYADKRIGSKISTWRKSGKKVIVLPQAFGPFNNGPLKVIMEKIIANADLIFARDKQSYGYLRKISDSDNILQAPDFTNLLEGRIPENFDVTNKQVAIIPNYKMMSKKGDESKLYINFLHRAINKINAIGLKPYFLIHEGKQDIEISNKVNNLLKNHLEIIVTPDPLVLKGIISTAFFIVCSRFHGVVSALSQGVPCISTSWSHKYEMLHQEYDYEDGLLKNIGDLEEIEKKITELSDPETNRIVSKKLNLNSYEQKVRSAEMWRTVFNVIN